MSGFLPPAISAAKDVLDPLLQQGYEININKTIDVDVDGKDTPITIKVSHVPAGDAQLSGIRIELTREEDIFYVARCDLDAASFTDFAKKERLHSKFGSFISDLEKITTNVQINRASFMAIYQNNTMTFRQKLEFKSVDIFSISFNVLEKSDPYVADQAQFRFDFKRSRLRDTIQTQKDLFDHIQKKNPQLLEQIKKGQEFNATKRSR